MLVVGGMSRTGSSRLKAGQGKYYRLFEVDNTVCFAFLARSIRSPQTIHSLSPIVLLRCSKILI